MKNLLILDVSFSYGHQKFNYHYIKIMVPKCHLSIINDGKYYNSLSDDGVELLNYHRFLPDSGSIKNRVNIVNTFKRIARSKVLDRVDAVLVVGYDTLSFPMFYFLCKPNVKVYVIQHHNIDENHNMIKHFAFNTYKNKMVHLVLDKSFVIMLRNKWKVKSKIEYLPHYLSKYGVCQHTSLSNDLIALSNSNDEDKIKTLIELDRNGILNDIDIYMNVKSNMYEYESEHLKIYRGYISDDVYEQCFKHAKVSLILFPDDYDIRFSCTLIEAIINYKMVIGYSIPFVHEYAQKYPNNVIEYRDDKQLLELIKTIPKRTFDYSERERLLNELSNKQIESALDRIFNNYKF